MRSRADAHTHTHTLINAVRNLSTLLYIFNDEIRLMESSVCQYVCPRCQHVKYLVDFRESDGGLEV
jgi:hypothetical protein